MKISEIQLNNFKRFTNLKITNISPKAKIVIIVGPNGSGKSSLFDALNIWYKNILHPYTGRDDLYYPKNKTEEFNYDKNVKINFHDFIFSGDYQKKQEEIAGKFYFRTAYRNQADFTMSSLSKMDNPKMQNRINYLIENDSVVSENYQRLVSLTLKSVFETKNDNKNVKELRNDLIGKIRKSVLNVFDNLKLSSIGDPLNDGTFYFEKGNSKNFHYKNLSGGEKAGFDLLLDLIVKSSYFDDCIYCIDEPETHIHTKSQSKLFEEIYNIIPDNSQLWINTHSLGILKKAKELAKREKDKIVFINFDEINFDEEAIIKPSNINKNIWQKSIEITLDDMSKIIEPQNIILCEGDVKGRKNKNFDSEIYNKIFSEKYDDTIFISLGSSNDIENDDNQTFLILKNLFKQSNIIRLLDCDDKTENEILELKERGIKVLSKRHIESYLWDDEILEKLCEKFENPEKFEDLLKIKEKKLRDSNEKRGNSKDDIKSASAEIYAEIKKLFNLTKTGSTKEVFLKETIAPLITFDTSIFKELEKDIFE